MTKSSTLYVTLIITFLPTLAISSSHHHHENKLKFKQFTLYDHDIYNKTDLLVVPGVAGTNFTQTQAPFGTITVLSDNLTLTPDPSSKIQATVEALTATSSFDGLDGIAVIRYALELEDGLKGTISGVGVANVLKTSDVPLIGGTGDFVLVQGFIRNSLVSFEGPSFVYKSEFNLFWPPYAPYAMKG